MAKFDIRRILAPTDLSTESALAMRYARELADHFGARLIVLHAHWAAGMVPAFDTALVDVETDQDLRQHVTDRTEPWLEGRPFEVVIAAGRPDSAILAHAEQLGADLIVMGTHGRSGWERTILGSTAERVMHRSRVPVIAVGPNLRPDASPVIRKIVCPVNFTSVARKTLQTAVSLAAGLRAELIVVHVVEPADATDPAIDEARVREWAGRDLPANVIHRELVVRGDAPVRVLECVAEHDADLLVIGAQHRLFRDVSVVGRTTERLVRLSPSAIMTVSIPVVPKAREMEAEEALTAR